MRTPLSLPNTHRGAALLAGMIFLVVTTVIALAAIGSTVLQERMTGGQRNDSLAQQGSESALRGAERALWQLHAGGGSGALIRSAEPLDASVRTFRKTPQWVVDGQSYADIDLDGIAQSAGSGRLDRDPVFIIERLAVGATVGPSAPGGGGGASLGLLETHQGGGPSLSGNGGSGASGTLSYYRITARSTGGDPRVIRSSESIYVLSQ